MESSGSSDKDGPLCPFTGPSCYGSNKFMIAIIPDEYLKPGMPRYQLATNPYRNEKVTSDFPATKWLRAMFPRSPEKQSDDPNHSNSELNSSTERMEDSRKMQSREDLFEEPPRVSHSALFKQPHELSRLPLLGELHLPPSHEQSHASLGEQPHGTSYPEWLEQPHETSFEQSYGSSHPALLRLPHESSHAKPVGQSRPRIAFPIASNPSFNKESPPIWVNEDSVFQNSQLSPQVTQPIGAPQFSYNANNNSNQSYVNNQSHTPHFQSQRNFYQRGRRSFEEPRFEQNQNYAGFSNRSGNWRPYRNNFQGRNRIGRGRNNNRNWPQQEYHNYK